MQTLRKKTSPLKYKNDPSRFLGDGMTFKAKLIGILEVNEARGDKMCQDALNDLKTAVRAAGEHKQRITISIAIDGLRLRDEKTGDSMYHHPVHKISFIAQDMSDSRAFGYIFGSPDTGHRFFGIKTDKTASQVVIAMRDLFQVVFELKKKEIEMAKHQIEVHQLKAAANSSYAGHTVKDEEIERIKLKLHLSARSQMISHSAHATSPTPAEGVKTQKNTEAIADLLDLEDELHNIQQGINQMDKITPSDPFGPLNGKGDTFMDSFKDKTPDTPALPKPSTLSRRTISQGNTDGDKDGGMFSATSTSSRAQFFPQFSPNVKTSKEENYWFDQETDSLFTDAVNNPPEPVTSPVTFHTPTGDETTLEEARSVAKTDLFTDLDPLGTGRVKPYLDKKDFFQELKNPPKKVLKELMPEPPKLEATQYFPVDFEGKRSTQIKIGLTSNSVNETSVIKNKFSNTSANPLKSIKSDPFEDTDPFEKSDPFLEESFPKSIGFPPILQGKISLDYTYDKVPPKDDEFSSTSPSKSNLFSSSIHGPLRVSLPPEKSDTNTTISLSSIASRFRSSPSPTDEPRSHRRKHYQTLKHSFDDRSDDQTQSPILEEVYMRGSPKPFSVCSTDKKYFVGSPPASRQEKMKSKISSSLELLDSTPDLPLRTKTSLYAIKPPPLPPKKQNQPSFRPPARPPSLEDPSHYDYLRHQVDTKLEPQKVVDGSPKKKHLLNYSDDPLRKNSILSSTGIPFLPPPPQRKTPTDSSSRSNVTTPTSLKPSTPENKSVLNITLNQLDQSGFETLASTLGIPMENVCNMTLQELTKMLAKKYLGTTEDLKENSQGFGSGIQGSTEFKADFESNFGDSNEFESPFDKYAPFKELLQTEDDTKYAPIDADTNETLTEETPRVTNHPMNTEEIETTGEEDKYAALRQLSLCAQKSENLSEELDISNEDDSSARADNISDIIKHHTDDSFTPLNVLEMTNESPVSKSLTVEETEEVETTTDVKTPEKANFDNKHSNWSGINSADGGDKFDDEQSFFGVGQDDTFDASKDDWATFEKDAVVQQNTSKLSAHCEGTNDTENSPVSSDGKEDSKDNKIWPRKPTDDNDRRPNAQWNDEDESWDDYSPKESYWSDESSHDGHSPLNDTLPAYLRRPLHAHSRQLKGPPIRTDNVPPWRRKWEEDTEDEYDDIWRKRRIRPNSFDRERKREKCYEIYQKQLAWGREKWDGDRLPRGYEDWRKSSMTSGDYRRRCDSDASDKEYSNLDSRYSDKRGEKTKLYYKQQKAAELQWPDQRESRCKFKKPMSHKRPSSASEAKRYDKMYSTVEHSPRSLETAGFRDSEDEDFPSRFHMSRKEPKYHSNIEYYGSYDRRSQTMHHRRVQKGKRGEHINLPKGKDLAELTATEVNCITPSSPQSAQSTKHEETEEVTKELHFKFEDDFMPSPAEKRMSPRNPSAESHQKIRFPDDDWNKNENASLPQDNNNISQQASFGSDFETSNKGSISDKGKSDGTVAKKPSLKGKNHFAKLGRQESCNSLRKSESINIFSRDSDPFEDDDFFSAGFSPNNAKLNKFAEKSKSNSNVSDPFAWKEMFSDIKLED